MSQTNGSSDQIERARRREGNILAIDWAHNQRPPTSQPAISVGDLTTPYETTLSLDWERTAELIGDVIPSQVSVLVCKTL